MLTYAPIVRQLTEREKVVLLTNIHSMADPALAAKGLPGVRVGWMREACEGHLPSPRALARSWDGELISDTSAFLMERLAEGGADHVVVPGGAIRLSPVGEELSEDPLLSGELARRWLKGAARGGISVSLSGYGAGLAGEVSPRYRRTFVEEPYRRALRDGIGAIVMGESPALTPVGEGNAFRLCRSASEEDTVRAIRDGIILLEGSASALELALHRHRRLRDGVQRGLTTIPELEAAEAAGEALSEEALDEAVDRLIRFAVSCGEGKTAPVGTVGRDDVYAELARRGAAASLVLLENRMLSTTKKPALPLSRGTEILVVGDMADRHGTDALAGWVREAGLGYAGFARGYRPGEIRSDDLAEEAASAAVGCAHALVFLGTDVPPAPGADGSVLLPANQRALCHKLGRLGVPVTLVLGGDVDWDLSFLSDMATPPVAILLADPASPFGVETVLAAVAGRISPAGRLTATLCARNNGLARPSASGLLPGYRYYDTVGFGAVYPFGHGLTYTAFRYSRLKEDGFGNVSFRVRNVGSVAGVEIAQVYQGIKRSAVLSPRKELVGFVRVALEPDEETTVTLPVGHFFGEDDPILIEKGTYTLYVGASVEDIRLTMIRKGGAVTLPSDGIDPSEHLPSVTNVQTKRYGMEAVQTPMKSSYRNLVFGIASLTLGVGLKVYDILTSADALFLDVVAGLLAAGAAAFFVLEVVDRKKRYAELRRLSEAANEAAFADAATVSVPSAAKLFEEGLYLPDETAAPGETVSAVYDPMADVDPTLTPMAMAEDLTVLAPAHGLSLSLKTATDILAAVTASRLVLVKGMSEEAFGGLAALLGAYFGSPMGVDIPVDGGAEGVVQCIGAGETPCHLAVALEAAARTPHTLHGCALSRVTADNLSGALLPFVCHARSPHGGTAIALSTGEEPVNLSIPANFFALALLDGDTRLGDLPAFAVEVASVLTAEVEICLPVETVPAVRRCVYGQTIYLAEQANRRYTVDEELWKRIDRLEAYAVRSSDFCMGNKLRVALETHIALRLATGQPALEALDAALASKMIPVILASATDNGARGLRDELDEAFGEGDMPLCRRLIKEAEGI